MSQPIFNITTPGFTPDIPGAAGGPAFSRPYTTDLTPQDIISISTRSGEPKKNGFAHNLKDYGKGLFNGGWNTITSLLSLKGMAFALGTAGLVWMTGGTILPLMAVAGLGLGTVQTLKGALSGNWEQAGEGTFALGASMLGMKGISKTPKWMKPWIQTGQEQTARLSGVVDSATAGAKNLGNQVSNSVQSMITGAKEQFSKVSSMVSGKTAAQDAAVVTENTVNAEATVVATEKPPGQGQATNEAPKTAQAVTQDATGANPAQNQAGEKPLKATKTNEVDGGDPKASSTKEGYTTSETTQTNGADGGDPKASSTKEGETKAEATPTPPPKAEPPSSQNGNPLQTLTNTTANDNQAKVASGVANSNWGKCKEQTSQFFKKEMVSGHIYSGTIPNSFSGISNSGTDN